MNRVLGSRLVAGLYASIIFGVLVLGYLLYGAYGSYSEIAEKYEMQCRELDRLRSLRPYPDLDNLKKEEDQRDALADQIDKLQSRLAKIKIPLISSTPEQFQDELRMSVFEVAERAAAQGASLPKDFYLGFQEYRDTLPADRMAATLRRQLEAIKFVVSALLDNHVSKISEVQRMARLRSGDATSKSISETKGRTADAIQQSGSVQLVTRHPFEIGFTATQSAFRRALNAIATTPQQFYIVDLLNVANEELSGPPRRGAAEVPQDDASPEERIHLILGDEELNVRLRIQIVDILDPGLNSAALDEG